MKVLGAIPSRHAAFSDLVHNLFSQPEKAGLSVRYLTPPDSPTVTVVHIRGLVGPADFERLVLVPISAGGLDAAPEALAASGRFTAPALEVTGETGTFLDLLYAGLSAIHIDGYPGVLLLGAGHAAPLQDTFGTDLSANLSILMRHLPNPDFRVEDMHSSAGLRCAIAYLEGTATTETVDAVRAWVNRQTTETRGTPVFRALIGNLRIPPTVDQTSPAAMAAWLRKGYVAILADHLEIPLLAPTTVELLLSAPKDVSRTHTARRLAAVPRLIAALIALTTAGGLTAVSVYHHSLMPGPFLVALAASRQNMPFPTSLEVLLVSLLADTAEAAALRSGGSRLLPVAWVGTVLAIMAGMQVGVLGAVTGLALITSAVVRITLPTAVLRVTVRIWQYLFVAAAVILGIYGMALLGFVMVVYLGEERAFGHPIRVPAAVSS